MSTGANCIRDGGEPQCQAVGLSACGSEVSPKVMDDQGKPPC